MDGRYKHSVVDETSNVPTVESHDAVLHHCIRPFPPGQDAQEMPSRALETADRTELVCDSILRPAPVSGSALVSPMLTTATGRPLAASSFAILNEENTVRVEPTTRRL